MSPGADPPPTNGAITTLLQAWSGGDGSALDRLMPLVYDELRALARLRSRGEAPGSTLTPTAIVHELYLKLAGEERAQWQNRRHFFAVAARLIRRILVDHARERGAQKRAGDRVRVELAPDIVVEAPLDLDLLALDQALDRLATLDARQAEIVGLRYFLGLSVEEAAELLGLSTPTVKRDFRSARAFLQRELAG